VGIFKKLDIKGEKNIIRDIEIIIDISLLM